MATFTSSPEFDNLVQDETLSRPLEEFQLDYEFFLEALEDYDYGLQSIAASGITLVGGVAGVDTFVEISLTGSGIAPVSTLAGLEQAILDGIASGALNRFTVTQLVGLGAPTPIFDLTMSPAAYTITSGQQSLTLRGADLPNTLDEISALAGTLSGLDVDSLVFAT